MLSSFKTAVRKDFHEQRPSYPIYPTPFVEWELTAANPMLSSFKTAVRKDFHKQRPSYLTYPTPFVSIDMCAARGEASTSNSPFKHSSTSSPVPGFNQKGPLPSSNQERQLNVPGVLSLTRLTRLPSPFPI